MESCEVGATAGVWRARGQAQDNFTDPDSRIMPRSGGGFDAAYNGQTSVDDTPHIIVTAVCVGCA